MKIGRSIRLADFLVLLSDALANFLYLIFVERGFFFFLPRERQPFVEWRRSAFATEGEGRLIGYQPCSLPCRMLTIIIPSNNQIYLPMFQLIKIFAPVDANFAYDQLKLVEGD